MSNSATGNVFKKLKALISDTTTDVGTITANNFDGSYTVDLQDGGTVKAYGTGFSVGNRVFINNGRITSQAPAFTAVEIDV